MSTSTWLFSLTTLAGGYFLRELAIALRLASNQWMGQHAVSNDLIFPLIRVSDELVGRTYHHIRDDFQRDISRPKDVADITDHDQLYDLYLWTRFWAHISRIRRNILSYNLSKTKNGKNLLRFLDCLEANKVSIVPRAYQKFVGDAFGDKFGIDSGGSYFDFVEQVKSDSFFCSSLNGVNELFRNARLSKNSRHEFIKYTIIIHAMNDYLDPKRKVSSPRKPMQNKLGKAARRDLRLRILPVYTPITEFSARAYAD